MEAYRLLMGVEPGKYSEFRDLKRRVLEKSIQEVNEISNIEVTPEIKYLGRLPSQIRFKIKQNKSKEKGGCINEKDSSGDLDKLKTVYGLSVKRIKELKEKYGTEYIQSKMNIVEASDSYQKGTIKSLSGYLNKAITEDYSTNISSDNVLFQKKRAQAEQADIKLKAS